MKKILISSVAALCAAMGFSSFKTAEASTYYWFKVTSVSTYPLGMVPTGVKNINIVHSIVSMTLTKSLPAFYLVPCVGSNYVCMVGFGSTQLTASHKFLLTSIDLAQTAVNAGYTRN